MDGELGDVVQLVGDEVGVGPSGTGDTDQHRVELPLLLRQLDELTLLFVVGKAAGQPAAENGQAGLGLDAGDIDLVFSRFVLPLDGAQRVHQ